MITRSAWAIVRNHAIGMDGVEKYYTHWKRYQSSACKSLFAQQIACLAQDLQ